MAHDLGAKMRNSPQIVRSHRAAERIAAAREWLAAAEPATETLVITPTREAADDLVRGVAAARGAVAGIHRLTFNRLIGLLASEAMVEAGLAPASALAAQAIAARAIFHLAPSGKLKHFAPVTYRPGFAEALARTIAELRQAAVMAGALCEVGAAGGELAVRLARFEEELARARLIDRAGMLALAIDAVAKKPRFVGIPTLLLDVPVDSTRERDLVAALAQNAPQFLATVPAGDERGAQHLSRALATPIRDACDGGAHDSTSLAA